MQPDRPEVSREFTDEPARLDPLKSYAPPRLTFFGTLLDLTQKIKGGPVRDGGSPPFHKTGKKSK